MAQSLQIDVPPEDHDGPTNAGVDVDGHDAVDDETEREAEDKSEYPDGV